MRYFTILYLVLIVSVPAIAQRVLVREAKKCTLLSGKKVKPGDSLRMSSEVEIKPNGKLIIVLANGWPEYFNKPGKFRIDSMIMRIKTNKNHNRHDSISKILQDNKLDHCNYKYTIAHSSLNAVYEVERIILTDRGLLETTADSIKLSWSDPLPHKGKYFVIIKSLFDESIDIKVTDEKYLILELKSYKQADDGVVYSILSDDCRESLDNVIHFRERTKH